MVKAPRAWNQTFQFVTAGDDDEHFVNQIMGEHAMGLIQVAPFSPRITVSTNADAQNIAPPGAARLLAGRTQHESRAACAQGAGASDGSIHTAETSGRANLEMTAKHGIE
jgi:hypothetical protein